MVALAAFGQRPTKPGRLGAVHDVEVRARHAGGGCGWV